MLNKIIQEYQNLIGAKEDIDALAQKDHARLLVLSDSHGNYKKMEKIIRQYGAKCDAFVFCGDGACDLANLLATAFYDDDLKACIPPVIAFVRGNNDPGTYPVNGDFSLKVPYSQVFTVNSQNIFVTHGHREGVDFGMENLGLEMQLEQCRTAFFGHTHFAEENRQGDYKFINPGSCSRPRGGQPASFAIATVEKTFVDLAFIKMTLKSDGSESFEFWTPVW